MQGSASTARSLFEDGGGPILQPMTAWSLGRRLPKASQGELYTVRFSNTKCEQKELLTMLALSMFILALIRSLQPDAKPAITDLVSARLNLIK